MSTKKKLNCILLVDDDRATNFLHSLIVEETGMAEHIAVVESGDSALGYLDECAQEKKEGVASPVPDLIFLDINMPVMSGWEFLQEYGKRSKEELEKIVMVMLTASPNPDDESKAKTFPSVKEYRRKPLTGDMLTEIVSHYFE